MTTTFRYGLSDLLRGLAPGRMQAVGLMQIIPLVGAETAGYAPADAVTVASPDYGVLDFRGDGSGHVIIPSGAAYLTKERKQDHALPHPGLVRKRDGVAHYNSAACIQSSMPGHMESAKRALNIMPFALRAAGLRVQNEKGFQKLWGSIERMNHAAGLTATGHLDVFLNHFAAQLDQFAAEFEPVPEQLGAIVIVNGAVAGIERSPTYEHWLSVWKPLVRDCYGSHAMLTGQTVKSPPGNRFALGACSSLQDLAMRLGLVRSQEDEATRAIVRGLMAETFEATYAPQPQDEIRVYDVSGAQFTGNAIIDSDSPVYLSLLANSAKSGKAAFSI